MKVQQVSPGIINKIKSLIARVGYLKSDIGIVEDTDTATHTISSGQYVIWKNELYKASTAIPSGDPLSSTNLTAVSDGIANELNGNIITLFTNKINKVDYWNELTLSAVESQLVSIWNGMSDGECKIGCVFPQFSDTATGFDGGMCPVICTKRSSSVMMAHFLHTIEISVDYYYSNAHHWYKI